MGARYNVASSGKVVWLIWAAIGFGEGREGEWIEECLKDVKHFLRLKGVAARVEEVVGIRGEFWVRFEGVLRSVDSELDMV